MFKGKLIELPQLEHPPLIYETTLLLMIICLFIVGPAFFFVSKNEETQNMIEMWPKDKTKQNEGKLLDILFLNLSCKITERNFWNPSIEQKNQKDDKEKNIFFFN